MFFFSPTSLAFYADEFRDAYEAAGSWPADGVQVADETWRAFAMAAPEGKRLGAMSGQPAWVDAAPAPVPQRISSEAFRLRFTDAEQLATQILAGQNPLVALGLTRGITGGTVDLLGQSVADWMALVVAGGAVSPARAAIILTP